MAADKDYLRQLAIAIRDEYRKGANTAYRVGSLLLSLIDTDANIESLSQYFIRKDKEDVAKEIITFLKGLVSNLVQSEGFSPGEFGSGFILRNDDGGSYLEIDRLLVRRIAYFVELVIKSLKHVGGSLVLSPASMVCSKVEEYDAYYRCYFEHEREGRFIYQEFVPGDQARAQEFNVKEGVNQNVASRFYWRLVIAVGDNYIDLSKSDAAVGSVAPQAGDDIVLLGNRDDVTRQNAIILSTIGDDAPSIKQYKGINSYSTEGKEITIISSVLNSFTGRFKSSVTGEDFDTILDQFKTELTKIKSQTDKEYTIWFYNYTPTLQNEPASGWSDADKIDHEYDIFYYPDEGLAWRFLEGTWKPITDQQTLRALEKAAKAQDTADGKRRNFVDVPVPPYDIGDTWSNAYYGTLYTNDNLVCVKAKAQGEAFSIDDWTPSSDMNSATKKIFESLIEQLDNRITLQVTAHDELKETVTALGIRMDGAEEQITIYANKTNTLEGTVTQLGIDLDAAEEQISIYATKVGTLEGTVKQLGIDLDAAEGSISAIAGLFDKDGHLIEGSGWVTTTEYNSLYSVVQDIDGALSAKAEVRTSVQYDPNTGAVTSAIKLTADKISLEGATTINNSFSVGTDGTTRIAGFTVSGNGLINSGFDNDAYVIFRNDTHKTFAGIGGNVLPSATGLRAVARFENHDTEDFWYMGANYAMLVSAQGGRENVAIQLNGGSVACLALKTQIIGHDNIVQSTAPTSKSVTLGRDVGSLYVSTQFNWKSSSSATSYESKARDIYLTLPTMDVYDDGHTIKIKRGSNNSKWVYISPGGSYRMVYNSSIGSYVRTYGTTYIMYDGASYATTSDKLGIESEGDAMELVYHRDLQITINNITYYGCWIQHKHPRSW